MPRPPKSIEEKRLNGNPGKQRLDRIMPPAPPGAIPCPQAVAQNPRARGYWDHFILTCAPGALAPVDGPALGNLSMALALADDAYEEMLAAGGQVVKAPKSGTPMQSAYLSLWWKHTEMARRLTASLCLSPAERNRVVPRGLGKAEVDEFGF